MGSYLGGSYRVYVPELSRITIRKDVRMIKYTSHQNDEYTLVLEDAVYNRPPFQIDQSILDPVTEVVQIGLKH